MFGSAFSSDISYVSVFLHYFQICRYLCRCWQSIVQKARISCSLAARQILYAKVCPRPRDVPSHVTVCCGLLSNYSDLHNSSLSSSDQEILTCMEPHTQPSGAPGYSYTWKILHRRPHTADTKSWTKHLHMLFCVAWCQRHHYRKSQNRKILQMIQEPASLSCNCSSVSTASQPFSRDFGLA